MKCRKNAIVVNIENSQMAVTSTKFWDFLFSKNLRTSKTNFTLLNVFYISLKVFYIFYGKSEPPQRPAAAVAPDNKAWFK